MNKDLYEFIGSEIRAQRARIKMPQDKLAQIIGVGPSAISQYESGQRMVSIAKLYKIARALECEPSDFLPSSSVVQIFEGGEQ
jgi:transcriptional regulator with XRE-family HTH domain